MSGLFKVPFFEDEILTSYLSRTARANGRSSSYLFCGDLGLDVHAINRGEDNELEKLAGLLERPAEELKARALRLDERGLAIFGDSVFGKNMLRKIKPGICPACLGDDECDPTRMPGTRRYQRVSWLLADVRSCPDHNCQLVEIDGFRDHRRMDFQLMLDRAGARIYGEPVRRTVTSFEKFVCERLVGLKSHGALLNSFSLSAAISACTLFGIAAEYGREKGRSNLNDEQLTAAVVRGFDLLAEGQAGICRLLDALIGEEKAINTRGGRSLYGRLYRRLLNGYPGPEFDRIRSIIRDYTIANVPLLPGSDVFGEVKESSWRTVTDVARENGVATSVIYKLLQRRGHTPSKYDSIHGAVAIAIADELSGMVDGKEACAVLGTTRTIFRKLVCSGFIPVNGPAPTSGDGAYTPFRRYSRVELLQLRNGLVDRANSPVQADMLNVSAASRLTKVPAAEILACLLKGELTRVGYRESGSLLDSLHVVPREVINAALKVDGLSTEDAAAKLCVNRHSLLSLRARNHIKATLVGTEKQQAYIFPDDEIARFNDRFVSVTLLARETGISQGELRRRMRKLKITPAITPKEAVCAFLHRRHAKLLIDVCGALSAYQDMVAEPSPQTPCGVEQAAIFR